MPQYKQSYYNFVVSSGENVCLYNTKTGCVGVIQEDERKVIEVLNSPDEYIGTKLFKDFLNGQFITEYETNEIYDVAINFERANRESGSLNIIILPTESCNFSCPYCFVKENNIKMNKQMYKKIILYIDNKCAEYKKKSVEPFEVSIGWFGGEPTLCTEDIVWFMEELKKREEQIKITGKVVTNGFLLTPDLFRRFLNSNISNFQITLDGTADNHDKFRILKDGSGTFDIIYNQLINIKDENKGNDFEISIRGNFNKSNVSSMIALAKKFQSDFGADRRFDLSFRPVLDFRQEKNEEVCSKEILFCSKQEALYIQNELANFVYGNNGLMTNNRMFDVLPEPINKWCNVAKRNSIVIDPLGNIFACDSVVSDKKQAIGFLGDDGKIVWNKNETKWRETIFQTDKFPGCQQCKMLPVCLGGCARERMQNGCGCCTWTVDYIEKVMKDYCK